MADKTYAPGDTILQEEPWQHTIAVEEVERRCYFCLKWLTSLDRQAGVPVPLMKNNRCSGCKFARYCSKECQTTDWKERHKMECGALCRIVAKNNMPPDHFLLMLKIIAKLVHPKTSKAEFFGPTANQRTFSDLVAHLDEIRKDKELMEYLFWMRTMIGMYLGLTAEQMATISPVEFVEIYGKVKCNTFLIEGSNWERIGIALYLKASALDHSCAPNACQTFVGKRLTVSATKNIDSIKNVRISYVDPFEPRRIRQEKLLKMYHFVCSCPVCANPDKDAEMFSLCCLNPKCTAEIPSDDRANDVCPKCPDKRANVAGCDITFNNMSQLPLMMGLDRQGAFEKLYDQMTATTRSWIGKTEYDAKDKQDLAEIEKSLTKMMHPKNPLWSAFYIKKGFMLQSCADKNWFKCFEKALDLYRPWLSPVDPRIGWLAYYAANPGSTDLLDTLKKMDECRKVMGKTFGPDHEMVEEANRIHREYELKLRAKIGGRR